MTKYNQFFEAATGNLPYDYQTRLAVEKRTETLVQVPTGAGKTAAAIVGWLWQVTTTPADAGRRLIYCLPMRTLTWQTAAEARRFVENLGLTDKVTIHTLMGGDSANRDESWQLWPEKHAIIVGTEDMILSRLLNRGYAMNPLRWPVPFGLLTNDATWVFDEVQLLGDGLATSLQLQAFRQKLGAFGACGVIWMSATCQPDWLDTVDHVAPNGENAVRLSDTDREQLAERLNAVKVLDRAPEECRTPKGLAEFVRRRHEPGTLTLVVVNTVDRAVDTFRELDRGSRVGDLTLLHSRFRPADRREKVEQVLTGKMGPEGRIVVSTQVIEAGADISARLMVTDLAPYTSMVQRFGRVNRRGEMAEARIYWVDRPVSGKRTVLANKQELKEKDQEMIALPYEWTKLEAAQRKIGALTSGAPTVLPEVDETPEFEHVLRRRDIVDLFDTTPDLGGNDVDVSRFVRGGVDRDVFVAWRDWGDKTEAPSKGMPRLENGELCRVPVYRAGELLKNRSGWVWRPGAGEWEKADPNRLVPGMRLVVHASLGGYTEEAGWDPVSKKPVVPVELKGPREPEEAVDDDPLSVRPRPRPGRYEQTLAAHIDRVVEEIERILAGSPELGKYAATMRRAARCHDWGKALAWFQHTLYGGDRPDGASLLAKSCGRGRHQRPHLRHELASALALLDLGRDDLEAYLTAAHHGRIRLAIRSMPGEQEKRVRGIEAGDTLTAADLGGGVIMPETTLRLDAVLLGRGNGSPSWSERMTGLRDELGPFRLAYLEALLRMADERASAEPGEEVKPCQ